MESDLHLAVDRSPDFFAFYDMQQADIAVRVLEVDGRIEGLGTLIARPGYLDGRLCRVGYAGDLRLTRKVRGSEFLAEHYGELFEAGEDLLRFELCFTAIITSNRRAVDALTRRQERQSNVPVYTEFARYRIANVQFTDRKKPRRTGLLVRRATENDLPAIVGLLGTQHRSRPFGYAIDEAFLRGRLVRWPGLDIDSFWLAFDGDRLVGVLATWDAEAVKRYRVLGYHNRMRWIRLGFNLAAPFLGATPLPTPGGLLRYFYLTHVAIEGDDPTIMSALLDHVYAHAHSLGYHFFSASVLEDDPLASAWKRFRVTSLPAALYAVTRPGKPVPLEQLRAGRPGFEMALV